MTYNRSLVRTPWLLFVFFSLSVCQQGAAAPASLEIVNLLPGGQNLDEVKGDFSQQLGERVRFVKADPLMTEYLRWASPDPIRLRCDADVRLFREALSKQSLIPLPSLPEQRIYDPNLLLATELDLLTQQVKFLYLKDATETLAQIRTLLPCATARMEHSQLQKFFTLEALTHTYNHDGLEVEAFAKLLAVAPDALPSDNYPQGAKIAYQKAAERQATVQRSRLDAQGIEGDAFLNGLPLDDQLDAYPGEHLLQIKGPDGSYRSRLVTLDEQDVIPLAQLANFKQLTAEQVLSRLAKSLRGKALELAESEALDRYLSGRSADSVLFAVSGSTRKPELRIYRTGVGMISPSQPRGRTVTQHPVDSTSLPPPSKVEISVEASVLSLRGSPSAFLADELGLGYAIRVDMPYKRLIFSLRTAGFPMVVRDSRYDPDCSTFTGDSPPMGEPDLESAATCVMSYAPFSLAGSIGYAVHIGNRLQLVPGLQLNALYLPNVIVESASDAPDLLANAMMLGPSARLHLDFRISQGQQAIKTGLEVSAGVLTSVIDGHAIMAVPVELSYGFGLTF